jgi:hypothetical protein
MRRFIETASLYTTTKDIEVPPDPSTMIPDAVQSYCPICKEIRVFSADFYKDSEPRTGRAQVVNSKRERIQDPQNWPGAWKLDAIRNTGVYRFVGMCTYCKSTDFSCFLVIKPLDGTIRKVGQNVPPWMKPTKPEIQKALGDDYHLYQRALALMSEGFGMGACAYLRRLLEDQIDPLIEKLRSNESERGASADRLAEIDGIRNGRDFAAKARAVLQVVPESIRAEGNPLITLHSGYSAGMHGWSEEDCLAVAELSVEALEHVIVNLADQPKKHRDYVARLKALDKKRAEGGQ